MEKYGQEYKASYCQEGQILQNIGRNIKQTMARKGRKYGKIWAGILSKLWPVGQQMWINMGRNITQIVVSEAANMAHLQSWMNIVFFFFFPLYF
jgi:hypothetical protein